MLVDAITRYLPIFMLGHYYSMEYVGLYALAFQIVHAPRSVVSIAMSKVYYRQISIWAHQEGGIAKIVKLYKATVLKSALLGLPFVLLVIIFAPHIMPWVLGEKWQAVGGVMAYLVIWQYCSFFTVPISTTFLVLNRQEVALILRLFSLLARFLILYFCRDFYQALFYLTIFAGLHSFGL